ncbi:MAG: DUF3891 family protein [Miltoncostaeaceae bacterium]
MITTRVPEGIRVVMQTDHQSQCGLLAGAWGNAQFARPEPWGPVALAAEWHDEGWRQWEASPGVSADGEPRDFVHMPISQHMAIHRRSIHAARHRDEVTGMLVGLHCAGLVQRRMGLDGEMPDINTLPDPVQGLIRDEAAVQQRVESLMGDLDEAREWTWAAYRVLQAFDLLSLYLTWTGLAGDEPWTLRRVPRAVDDAEGVAIAVSAVDDRTCALDPWPFAAESVDAPVLARVIPDRAYANAAEVRTALLDAPLLPVPFRVVRA